MSERSSTSFSALEDLCKNNSLVRLDSGVVQDSIIEQYLSSVEVLEGENLNRIVLDYYYDGKHLVVELWSEPVIFAHPMFPWLEIWKKPLPRSMKSQPEFQQTISDAIHFAALLKYRLGKNHPKLSSNMRKIRRIQ